MRLSPSVCAVLWREVCSDDFVIDGEHIPLGADLGVSVYVPHHDASVFPDPFAFKPERWLESESEGSSAQLATQRMAFSPFGLGGRKCIGYKQAQLEIVLCVARTLWSLDMRRPEGPIGDVGGGREDALGGREKKDEFQLYEHVTSRHDGPFLQWAWRSDGEAQESQ